jgi:hypothetical protein
MKAQNILKWMLFTTVVYAAVYRIDWTRSNVLSRTAGS